MAWAARSRWRTRRVVIVDHGDRIVVRPLPEDPIGELRGKHRHRGPSTQHAREIERGADAAREGPGR